jgi:hypothetical protein
MSNNKNLPDFLEEAAKYELLAQFYKYSNPNLHIQYYLKHLNSMKNALKMKDQYPNFKRKNDDPKIRFLHTALDITDVDIFINNQKFIKNVSYLKCTDYFPIQEGDHQIDLYPSGSTADPLFSQMISVSAGKFYTIAIFMELDQVILTPYLNQPEVPIGESKVRFLHLSPDYPSLDIAVKDRDVIFSNLSFTSTTEYLGLTPMTVDLEARESGTKNVIFPMPKSKFLPNKAYTLVLIGKGIERKVLFLID